MTLAPDVAPLSLSQLRKWEPRKRCQSLYTDPGKPTYLSISPLANNSPFLHLHIQSHYPGRRNKSFSLYINPPNPAHALLIENIESEKPYPPFMLLDLLSDLIPELQEYLTQVQYSP